MDRDLERSLAFDAEARQVLPGGVTSNVRQFDPPIHFTEADGSRLYDMDGNEYVDYLMGWGATILGHADDRVNERVSEVAGRLDVVGFGGNELERDVASTLCDNFPSAERVLFGVAGSEVVTHAIRLARGVTGRPKILKFQGQYNGWYDAVAMNHLSPPSKLGERDPLSAGILDESMAETIVVPYNDEGEVEDVFETHGDEIAAVILEPVAHNMGCVLPADGYLDFLRRVTDEHGALLVFDEIITGIHHGLGGVQSREGVTPDLTTLGKGLANGWPITALVGKAEYMSEFNTTRDGDVHFGGTYCGHPGALGGMQRTLELLEEGDCYDRMFDTCERIADGIADHVEDVELDAHVRRYGSTFLTYFTDPPFEQYRDVVDNDTETHEQYRWNMIDNGVLMIPSDIRRNYVTPSHDDEDVRRTIEAAGDALRSVADS